jgi:hypothetical protein
MPLSNRELLWLACLNDCGQVICNLCGAPVKCGEAWDESHIGAPKALGGKTVGVAHHKCNLDHGAQVVTPMVAKTKRIARKHLGISGKGLGSRPMPGGRRSKQSKTIQNGVVTRQSQAEKHQAAMARRWAAPWGRFRMSESNTVEKEALEAAANLYPGLKTAKYWLIVSRGALAFRYGPFSGPEAGKIMTQCLEEKIPVLCTAVMKDQPFDWDLARDLYPSEAAAEMDKTDAAVAATITEAADV